MTSYTKRYASITILPSLDPLRGVIHDLGNILTALGGHVAFLKRGAVDLYTQVAMTALIGRAQSLVKRLSQPAPSDLEKVDVGRLLRQLGPVMRSMTPRQTSFDLRTTGTLRARATTHVLETMVLNLVANAGRASGEGGWVSVHAQPKGRAIEVEVAGSGPGIDPERLDDIFLRPLPAVSQHQGLGLLIVRDSLARLGAALEVSRTSARTAFTIELPPG